MGRASGSQPALPGGERFELVMWAEIRLMAERGGASMSVVIRAEPVGGRVRLSPAGPFDLANAAAVARAVKRPSTA